MLRAGGCARMHNEHTGHAVWVHHLQKGSLKSGTAPAPRSLSGYPIDLLRPTGTVCLPRQEGIKGDPAVHMRRIGINGSKREASLQTARRPGLPRASARGAAGCPADGLLT